MKSHNGDGDGGVMMMESEDGKGDGGVIIMESEDGKGDGGVIMMESEDGKGDGGVIMMESEDGKGDGGVIMMESEDGKGDGGVIMMESEDGEGEVNGDVHTVYYYATVCHVHCQMWPEGILDHFKPVITGFYSSCKDLVLKLLLYMGKSLQLEVSVWNVHIMYICI